MKLLFFISILIKKLDANQRYEDIEGKQWIWTWREVFWVKRKAIWYVDENRKENLDDLWFNGGEEGNEMYFKKIEYAKEMKIEDSLILMINKILEVFIFKWIRLENS